MRLMDYLRKRKKKITYREFAARVGLSPQAVHRYATRQRIPNPEAMVKIEEGTGGRVRANDFYGQMLHK